MHKVKVSKTLRNKNYFWYLFRCLYTLRDREIIQLEEIDNPYFEEKYYELIYINDYPIFIDVRDDFAIVKRLDKIFDDFILLKSNFSTEVWQATIRGGLFSGFEYELKDWEINLMPKIKSFIHGRAFGINYKENELTKWQKYIQPQPTKYKVVSLSGAGVFKLQTQSRLKVYDLFKKVFGDKLKLMFYDRKHLVEKDKNEIQDFDQYLKKYKNDITTKGYGQYIRFLSLGDFSINFPGLCLSTAFRFVDSVIANRCIISTKIYHDLYKTFPCIQLPICGYFGDGNWKEAQNILEKINLINQKEMLKKAKDWYSWFLSPEGFWKNQLLCHLENKK